MAEAVLAALEIGTVVRTHSHAYSAPDDYWR
jgi:hypothetical protein